MQFMKATPNLPIVQKIIKSYNIKSEIKPSEKLILITTLYNCKNKIRMDEFIFCIKENSKLFKKMIVIIEDIFEESFYDQFSNIHFIKLHKRATFNNLIEIGNKHIDKIIVISNTDIIFGNDIFMLNPNKSVYTIHRQENNDEYSDKGIDAWVYKSPIKTTFNMNLGTKNCDLKFNKELSKHLKLINIINIKCLHIHDSGYRTWTKFQCV